MYYFIVNPNSKSGYGKKIWRTVQSELRKKKIPYKACLTKYTGHAKKLCRFLLETSDEYIDLIVVGGDGTLNEVLDGITDPGRIRLYYIPTGSGNDFARGMQLPGSPLKACQLLLGSAREISMDIGSVTTQGTGHRFGVSTGIGFDAAICHEALKSPLKTFLNHLHLGKLTYVFIAVKQFILCKPADFQVLLDGKTKRLFRKAYFAAIMNLPYEGGGIRFCPDASPNDRLLDVCCICGVGKLRFLFLLLACVLGVHKRCQNVHIFRCKSINIKSSIPLPVHRDGESGGIQSEIFVKLEKEPFHVILPML